MVLNVMKTLDGSNWGFSKETLVGTKYAIVRHTLEYAAALWYALVSSPYLDRLLEVVQKRLRGLQEAAILKKMSHFRAETGILRLRAYLKLCSHKFYANALLLFHPSHLLVTTHSDPYEFLVIRMESMKKLHYLNLNTY